MKTEFYIVISFFTSYRHQIRPPRFPKAEDETSTDGDKLTRAITSFDFSKHNPEIFIVGAEGGMIIQCSILGAAKLPSSTADAPVLDSAVMYYNKLQGEVTAVSFSPNRKDMFMTCSTSAEIRIYMIGQVSVTLITQYLFYSIACRRNLLECYFQKMLYIQYLGFPTKKNLFAVVGKLDI